MATVTKGIYAEAKKAGSPDHLEDNIILDGKILPIQVDLHQVLVLPKAEWEGIQDRLGSTAKEAARILAENKAREEMRLRSKAAIKDWPNTVMGLAQQKLKAKQLREEREEEERKLIDLEEAKFQAARRKETIDRAKTYLFYQNERVKAFNNAFLLAEVLKERDAQVEFKKLKSDAMKKKEKEMVHEDKEAVAREQEKARQHYMNEQAVRRDQLEQIKEHKHQADLAKLEDKREGEQIQRLNHLYQLEMQRGKEKEQEEKAEQQRLYHEHLADQKIIKAIEKQKQMEEDDRIKAYFKAKETIGKMVKKKKAEIRRLQQARQDKVVSQITSQMSEALKKESENLARAIAKKEAEYEKKCKEKEAKEKAAIKAIAEYRATVMKMKVEREQEEKEQAKKELNELKEKYHIYLEKEKAKKKRQHEACVEVQKFLIQQMAEKQAKNQQEKQADMDYEAQREAITLCKEREFQNYAKQVIESESKTTRHLYPLLKASRDVRGLGHSHSPEEDKE
ncbi:PREDICTED: coiled-coil domain-containing protein 173 [Chaetura pelagica]|uniref:coiled-coil domain-containing protein 173 n=1 Tax=Chaetura pelagica TaxID=8897 RepID=UPI0005239CB5|nr:PREDICTED: coiled-coil domain-containing protein 173 [Chaetura pelagica]